MTEAIHKAPSKTSSILLLPSNLLGARGGAQIFLARGHLVNFVLGEQFPGFCRWDGGYDHAVFASLPVGGGCHLLFGCELKGIDDT